MPTSCQLSLHPLTNYTKVSDYLLLILTTYYLCKIHTNTDTTTAKYGMNVPCINIML